MGWSRLGALEFVNVELYRPHKAAGCPLALEKELLRTEHLKAISSEDLTPSQRELVAHIPVAGCSLTLRRKRRTDSVLSIQPKQ